MKLHRYKVQHPNTVQLLGAVVNAKPYMIVYEFMTGGSVNDTLKLGGSFSQWRSLMLAIDLSKGLDHLHERPHPIIHGDIRPSSLLLGGSRIFNKFQKDLTYHEIGVLKVGYSVKRTYPLDPIKSNPFFVPDPLRLLILVRVHSSLMILSPQLTLIHLCRSHQDVAEAQSPLRRTKLLEPLWQWRLSSRGKRQREDVASCPRLNL
jgi:serine/threonine protein kinase